MKETPPPCFSPPFTFLEMKEGAVSGCSAMRRTTSANESREARASPSSRPRVKMATRAALSTVLNQGVYLVAGLRGGGGRGEGHQSRHRVKSCSVMYCSIICTAHMTRRYQTPIPPLGNCTTHVTRRYQATSVRMEMESESQPASTTHSRIWERYRRMPWGLAGAVASAADPDPEPDGARERVSL